MGKSRKRKNNDLLSPLPAKVSRPVAMSKKPIKKLVSQGTQTDGAYEITSMKKEGLKFLVSRIASHEANRATGNFKMCSIADKHFFLEALDEEVEAEDKSAEIRVENDFDDDSDEYDDRYKSDHGGDVEPHELDCLCFPALNFLTEIQGEDKKHYERWEEHASNYALKSEEINSPEISTQSD